MLIIRFHYPLCFLEMTIQCRLFAKPAIRYNYQLIFGSGVQKIPILITFNESGSDVNFMGIDAKYKRVWIRVSVLNKKCKPGDVVKCKVNLDRIAGFKNCGIPFYDGVGYKVVGFSSSIERFEYFKKRGFGLKATVYLVAKIREQKTNGQNTAYKFAKGRGCEIFICK